MATPTSFIKDVVSQQFAQWSADLHKQLADGSSRAKDDGGCQFCSFLLGLLQCLC